MVYPREPGPLVLFDGVCNLCNGAVNFLLDHDSRGVLRFASLQSAFGKQTILRLGGTIAEGDPDTMLFVDEGQLYDRSDAVLRIARHLGWPYRLLWAFRVLPRALRDAAYKWIARNRYRWFGKSEVCRVPTPELRARFRE